MNRGRTLPWPAVALAAALVVAPFPPAAAGFLNDAAGVSVTLTRGELTGNSQPVSALIDAPSVDAAEPHTQRNHVWIGGKNAAMGLRFDLGGEYVLQAFHLWNIDERKYPTYAVDTFTLTFRDGELAEVGRFTGTSKTGADGDPKAEHFDLGRLAGVRFVDVLLVGKSSGVDLTNIGFSTAPPPGTYAR